MRRPRILRIYILSAFLPAFFLSISFFVLLLELVDLFANLWKYLSLELPLSGILKIAWYYAPTCVSYSLPISLLFATAYTLGSLYSSNELIVVFSSGISLFRFALPLLLCAALLSGASFFFDDRVALPSYREKTRLSRELLGQASSYSNSDIAVLSKEGRLIYKADFYDDASKLLSGLTILERDPAGQPIARIEAASARWNGNSWVFSRARRFERLIDGEWRDESYGSYSPGGFDEPPESFRRQGRDLRELSAEELREHAEFQKRAGLPFGETLAERHKRFAFAFTPLVVVLLSSALGGTFKKNVLLMSLLSSLLASTGYYVLQMVTMLLAKTGLVSPVAGAWFPLALYVLIALLFFSRART